MSSKFTKFSNSVITIPVIETDALPSICAYRKCLRDPLPGKAYCDLHLKKEKPRRVAPKDEPYVWPRTKKMVYFVQSGEGGPIKIGFADDVGLRVKGLQVGNPCELRLLAAVPGGQPLEMQIHHVLRQHCIHGEWFHPHGDVMLFVGLAEAGDAKEFYIKLHEKQVEVD